MTNIQAKIWFGYGKAASYLGQTFSQYRPTAAANPISSPYLLGTIKAAFDDSPNFKFSRPNLYGHPEKFALVDGSAVLPGDYLTGSGGTFFIADMPPLMPIPAMECNIVATVLRPAAPSGIGAQSYGGDAVAAEVAVLTAWPASLLSKSRGDRSEVGLPGDVRTPWYEVLLPALSGVAIEPFDVLTDAAGQRYKISQAEKSSLGWRLLVVWAGT